MSANRQRVNNEVTGTKRAKSGGRVLCGCSGPLGAELINFNKLRPWHSKRGRSVYLSLSIRGYVSIYKGGVRQCL